MIKYTNCRILQIGARLGVALSLVAAMSAPLAHAQSWDHDWTYETIASGALPRDVALGGQDAFVFSSYGGVEGRTVLIDSDSTDPVTPEWLEIRDDEPEYETMAAATEANVFATLRVEPNSASTTGIRATLNKYSTGSQGSPDWSCELPIDVFMGRSTGVAVSADGARIVATGFTSGGDTHVYEFYSNSPNWYASHIFQLGSLMDEMRASADAQRIYFRRGPRVRVADLETGTLTQVASHIGGYFTGGDAMSGDGRTIAYSLRDKVIVHSQNSQGLWSQKLSLAIDDLSEVCTSLNLSNDGSVMAVGIQEFDYVTSGLLVVDTTGGAVRNDYRFEGSGNLTNGIGDVDLSRDGTLAALALWGDASGVVPEVSVFDTTGPVNAPPIYMVDLPGSALSVDLSDAGTQLVVGSRTAHIGTGGFLRGRIDRYSFDDQGEGGGDIDPPPPVGSDFVVQGIVDMGSYSLVTFRFRPEGAGRAFLLVSDSLASNPIDFGGVGILQLNRGSTSILQYHNFAEGSEVEIVYGMPSGSTQFFQGLSHAPRRLSTDWAEVTAP